MEVLSQGSAVLVIDVQNDFADPRGSLVVRGAEAIFEPLDRLLAAAERSATLVVYTMDWHPPSTPHFAKDGGIWPVHCVRDTWGAQLHPKLRRVQGAPIFHTGVGGEDGYSGFSWRDPVTGVEGNTGLDALLRREGISRLAMTGLATDYCVKETTLDALRLGYQTVVLVDTMRPVDLNPGDEERALEEMERAGAILRTVSEVVVDQEADYGLSSW